MLLIFILFIFFILHVQFLLRNIIWGTDEATYFMFKISYLFDQSTSKKALIFTLLCAACFSIGYLFFYRRKKLPLDPVPVNIDWKRYRGELLLLNISGLVQVVYGIYLLLSSGFNYQIMAEEKMSNGFVFELRIVYLIVLSHLLLNAPWSELARKKELRWSRWILIAYVIISFLGQTRSVIFEIGAVVIIAQLLWQGDKFKFKYLLFMLAAMLVPNLIVLGRLGDLDDFGSLVKELFSFEYSVLYNNMLSGVIASGPTTSGGLSFMPSLLLIIPSPVRSLLGLSVVKSDFYSDLASSTGVTNGGFSLLAEMFANFGWFALLAFLSFGMLLGVFFKRAARVGKANFLGAAAPLLYVAFVLAFRNDFGVFVKYTIQLVILAALLNTLMQTRLGK